MKKVKSVGKLKIKEKDLVKSALDYLNIRKIFCWRHNTGAILSEYKGKTRFMRFGQVGSPDIFALINGDLFGLECKGTGGKQSPDQKNYQKRFEKAGGIYLLIYSLEDLEMGLRFVL